MTSTQEQQAQDPKVGAPARDQPPMLARAPAATAPTDRISERGMPADSLFQGIHEHVYALDTSMNYPLGMSSVQMEVSL